MGYDFISSSEAAFSYGTLVGNSSCDRVDGSTDYTVY